MQEYVAQMKCLQQNLLYFLCNDDDLNEDFKAIDNYIKDTKININRLDFTEFIRILSRISKNHNNNTAFNNRIQKILLAYKEKILYYFSNVEIFNFFKSDKRILLFLIQNEILSIDQNIANLLYTKYEIKSDHFFYPEIKQFICYDNFCNLEKDTEIFNENFEQNRQIGQNKSYICTLIRQDSVEEFITYVNQTNLPLSGIITHSIFETNSFLNKNDPTIIEYAIFFDAIQIVKYLLFNNVELTSSLWIYAVHSNSAQMIHLLEEYDVVFIRKSIQEAIKCHHNDIVDYLYNNKYENTNKQFIFDFSDCLNINEQFAVKYRNYAYFPEYQNNYYKYFFEFSKNYYYSITAYIIKNKKDKIEQKIISNTKNLYPFCRYDYLSKNENMIHYYLILKNKSINKKILQIHGLIQKIVIPLSITSINNYSFEECSQLKEVFIPSSVTSIGKKAFARCSSLYKIKIPSSVIIIGEGAFLECSNLSKVSIPVKVIGNFAFKKCISLNKVIIPPTVTTIREGSFCDCKGLEELTIPFSVTTIGYNAFKGCSSLTNLIIVSPKTSFVKNVFENCNSITHLECDILQAFNVTNEKVKELTITCSTDSIQKFKFDKLKYLQRLIINSPIELIGFGLFKYCFSIKEVTITSSVKIIEDKSFYNCSSLSKITIPSSVTKIGNYSFTFCSFTQIFIPSSVKEIGVRAFEQCTSLVQIIFESQSCLEKIDECAFMLCTSLQQIEMPSSLVSLGKHAFSKCSSLTDVQFEDPSLLTTIEPCCFIDCILLNQIKIPSSVKSIGFYAFCRCSSLQQIKIPSSINSIDEGIFMGCSSLKNISFEEPSSIKIIQMKSFEECSSLKHIVIPSSVKYLGSSCFKNCSQMEQIIIPYSVTEIEKGSFEGCSSLNYISVPDKFDKEYLGITQEVITFVY